MSDNCMKQMRQCAGEEDVVTTTRQVGVPDCTLASSANFRRVRLSVSLECSKCPLGYKAKAYDDDY